MHEIREPLKGFTIKKTKLHVSEVKIPSIQRELSDNLVKRLMMSIEKVGFVEPILVIEGQEGYEVINGQHRLEAAKLLGLEEVPAVVLPSEIKDYIISLNTEKAPNLRDKAHQAYEIFSEYLKKNPSMEEYELQPMVEEPYYLTVGFVIERFGERRFPGYAFEKVLKKADEFLELHLEEAQKERERRAQLLLEVKDVLNEHYETLGLKNALQKEAIVTKAFQNIYGKRVRTIEDDFYTVFEKLKEEIPRVTLTEEELTEF